MKKRILMLLMIFCMIFAAMPVFAAEVTEQRVFDYADLLTETDEQEMHLWVEDMQENWGMDLAFLTTNDTKGKSVQQYGADFYIEHDLGLGENYDGVIFVLDMGTREGQIITSGKAIDIYTNYYIDRMWNNMVEYLSDGEYYWAMFSLYTDMHHLAEEYTQYLQSPDAYISEYQEHMGVNKVWSSMMVAFVFSVVVAFIGVFSMKRNNKNIRPYTDGRAYLKENGFFLTDDRSTFARTHTSMVPIPKDHDNHHHRGGGASWGGGSSTFSSGGRSFGGGGGKF